MTGRWRPRSVDLVDLHWAIKFIRPDSIDDDDTIKCRSNRRTNWYGRGCFCHKKEQTTKYSNRWIGGKKVHKSCRSRLAGERVALWWDGVTHPEKLCLHWKVQWSCKFCFFAQCFCWMEQNKKRHKQAGYNNGIRIKIEGDSTICIFCLSAKFNLVPFKSKFFMSLCHRS